jgi:hypothetical protein
MKLDILGLGSLNSAEEQELMNANELMKKRIAELEHELKDHRWDTDEVDLEVKMRTGAIREELEDLQREYKATVDVLENKE